MKVLFGIDKLMVKLPLIVECEDDVWYDYKLSFMLSEGTLYIDREKLTVTQAPLEIVPTELEELKK